MTPEKTINIRPLSGRGTEIVVRKWAADNEVKYNFLWGNISFDISLNEIQGIIKDFFPDGVYKSLGAKVDNPLVGGFGEYLSKNFTRFTPKHSSAIASLMVAEGFLSFNKKGASITLKRSLGKRAI